MVEWPYGEVSKGMDLRKISVNLNTEDETPKVNF